MENALDEIRKIHDAYTLSFSASSPPLWHVAVLEDFRMKEMQMLFNQRILGELSPAIAPEPPEPAAVPRSSSDETDFLREYQAVARSIGYRCEEAERKIAQSDLLAFLHEEGMRIYNYDAVKAYMDAITPSGHVWAWVGLRACDAKRMSVLNSPLFDSPPSYLKTIPMPVLETAKKIHDRFGDQVVMAVSDIFEVAKPDPFLAVSAGKNANGSGREWIVIERWDEPKFRDA